MLAPPRDLTLPEPGSTTLRRILGAYLRRLLDDLLALPTGAFSAVAFDDFSDVRTVVQRLLLDRRRGAVFSALRQPTISTLIRCLHAELRGAANLQKLDAWLAELTASIGLELALNGELEGSGSLLHRRPERLLSLSGGFELRFDPEIRLGFRPGRIVLVSPSGTTELEAATLRHTDAAVPGIELGRPFFPVDDRLVLACADNNPLSELEAHPEKQGNRIDLGGHDIVDWTSALRAALRLVEQQLPDLAEEIRLTLQVIVPVGADPERHFSASYAEAIGIAYLSLHPDPLMMAEALIHEFSHNKLNALFALDPVLENAFHPLYPSPVRPDPRPLHGVLLAVHAFTPVARLYERLAESGHGLASSGAFAEKFRQIVAGNHEAVETLTAHAEATAVGKSLIDELVRWDRHFQ